MSTKRHTAYNLAGAIAPVLMMLVSVPLYLSAMGEARYGVLAIVWLLTGYFGFFDFGLGRATAFAIARARDADDAVRADTFWTALIVNIGFGALGALVLWLAAPLLFLHVFNLSSQLRAELTPVLGWIALAIPLLTLEGVFSGALTGREKFLALNVRATVGTALTQFLPLLAVWLVSPTLDVAIPATIAARTLSVALLAGLAFRAVPTSARPRFGGKDMAKSLLGYGGWVSASSFLNPLIANLDRFLIATFLTPIAVTQYTVPFQLVSRSSVVPNALASALFPRFARQDGEEAKELAMRAIRANAAMMTVLCAIGIAILPAFLALWIDPDFAQNAALVGQLLGLSVWLNSIALVPFNLLQAQGRPRDTTLILLLQTLPFFLAGIVGVLTAGIVGVALARNLRSAIDTSLLLHKVDLLRRVTSMSIIPLLLLALIIGISNFSQFEAISNVIAIAIAVFASVFVADRIFSEWRESFAVAGARIRDRLSAKRKRR